MGEIVEFKAPKLKDLSSLENVREHSVTCGHCNKQCRAFVGSYGRCYYFAARCAYCGNFWQSGEESKHIGTALQGYMQGQFFHNHYGLYLHYRGNSEAYYDRIRQDEEDRIKRINAVKPRAEIGDDNGRKEKEKRPDEDTPGIDAERNSGQSETKTGSILMAKAIPIKLSSGRKRHLTAALAAILDVLSLIPGTGSLIIYIQGLAAALGITAISHGAVKKDLSKFKLAGLASLLSALTFLAYFVPSLVPYVAELQKLAALLGAGALGAKLAK